jgi:hypothetical protein
MKMSKKKIKKNGKTEAQAQVAEALKQVQELELTAPQAMALVQELQIVNLQLKVANNALVTEVQRVLREICTRVEELESKVFGEIQGDVVDLGGDSSDAMLLPTEQAKKEAAKLKRIQEADAREKAATSQSLGGPVGEPEEDEDEVERPTPVPSGSMFPRS